MPAEAAAVVESVVTGVGNDDVTYTVSMLGFALGGLIGAILALPVGAIVRDLYTYIFNHAKRESLGDVPATAEVEATT